MRIEKNTPADTEPAGDVLFCSFMQFFRIFFFEVFLKFSLKFFLKVFLKFFSFLYVLRLSVCFGFIRFDIIS